MFLFMWFFQVIYIDLLITKTLKHLFFLVFSYVYIEDCCHLPMARKHSLHILGGSGTAPCGRFHIGGIFQVGGGDGGWARDIWRFFSEIRLAQKMAMCSGRRQQK